MKEWTIPRHIESCAKKSGATAAAAAAEKQTFDCVLCNKSFSTIHFLFMVFICLDTS